MGLSKTQAVSAARLIKQATKSGALPKDLPHAGTILVGEARAKPPARHDRPGLTTAFVAGSDWSYSLDAGLLVDALTTGLLQFYRQAVISGEKPDGSGAQPELKRQAANVRDRKPGKIRGYRTGWFADNIRRSKITGSTTKAQSRILPPTNRNVFVSMEAKRGISYFSTQGTAAEVIADVTDKFIEGGIENRNRAADLDEKGSK